MEKQTLENTFEFLLPNSSNNLQVQNDRDKKELRDRILHLKSHLIEGGTSIQQGGYTSLQYFIHLILHIQKQTNNYEYYCIPLALFLYFQGQCLPQNSTIYRCYVDQSNTFFQNNSTNNLFVSNECMYKVYI
jgi:hypothetical protein